MTKSKVYILTVPPELSKYIDDSANKMGISDLDYIRYLIIKDKESKGSK